MDAEPTWQCWKLPSHKVTKRLAECIVVCSIAVYKVHWNVQCIVHVSLKAKPILQDKRQVATAVRVGVCPDMRAPTQKSSGLTLFEWAVGKQCGRDWLQGKTQPELVHHVGFAFKVQVDLMRMMTDKMMI